jgi:ankyrin
MGLPLLYWKGIPSVHPVHATRDGNARSRREMNKQHQGHVELAHVLLDYGADANAQDNQMCTPLYRAWDAGQLAVAQVLLRHGADVAVQCKNNETPLHRVEDEKFARLLLEHSADANALDIRLRNRTPLHRASKLGRVGAARALLEHGGDANALDANNATPLHLASRSKWDEGLGLLDAVRLQLQYSPDIHARDDEGRTLFKRTTAKEHHEIMRLLVEHGVEGHRVC